MHARIQRADGRRTHLSQPILRGLCVAGVAGLLLACSEDDASNPDAGTAPDAALPAPIPAAQVLPPSSYDCTSSGPYRAPNRPHPAGCFRDPDCRERLVVGHRMATPFAPENTLSGLRAAILLGVDIVETDVRTSSDGALVLIHDGTVRRTTTGSGSVDRMTLAELRALQMAVPERLAEGDFSCDRIPTLDEVFAVARGEIIVELEIKELEAAGPAARYLAEHDLFDHAYLLCDPGECIAARLAAPGAPIMSRPHAPEGVQDHIAYQPPPIMVHIDPTEAFLQDPVLTRIHAVGAKVYANGFIIGDALAAGAGDLAGYLSLYERGVEVLQVENPHWALLALGRL